jgi:tyrosine-protein kinase Etk/Wzc
MGNYSNDVNGTGRAAQAEKVVVSPSRFFSAVWSRWHWILASCLICAVIAFIYGKSSRLNFLSETIIQYDSKSKEAKFSTNSLLSGGNSESSDYMAEVYRIKSTYVLEQALKSLNTSFYFYKLSGLRQENLYPHQPFQADVLDYNVDKYPGGKFKLIRNGKSFDLKFVNKDLNIESSFRNVKEGSVIKVPGLSFRLKSGVLTEFGDVSFSYIDYWEIKSLASRIVIKEADRNMPVLRATFNSDNGAFTRDFLAAVINSYLTYDLAEKQTASEQTLAFINEQLSAFEGLMRKSSSRLEDIKQRYDLVDVGATSNQYMSSVADLKNRKLYLEVQGQNFDLVTDQIKNNKEVVANVIGWDGVADPFLNQMLQELNAAYRRRKQNLINYSTESIVVRNIDEEIAELKSKIIENINLQRKKAEQAYKAYDKQLKELDKDLGKMPSAERDLIYTTSDVEVNKNIYTLLLNKKLETNIAKAGQTASFKPIEPAVIAVRTAPKEMLIVMVGCIVGIVIGIVIVFLRRLFNNRFTNIESLEKHPQVPFLGIIKHHRGLAGRPEEQMSTLQAGNSALAEDLNAIRTNVLFQLQNKSHQVLSVTSANSGDGKSFISANIAVALTRLNKTVVLIDSDLRRPKLHKYLNLENQAGLADYLQGSSPLPDVIKATKYPNLSVISAGNLAGSSSELLHKDKFIDLLTTLKEQFDYVIIDTGPIGIMTDAIPSLRVSDLGIFVLRWGKSSKEVVSMPYSAMHNYSLNRLGIIINDYKNDPLFASMAESTANDGMHSTLHYGFKEPSSVHKWKMFRKTQ